SPDGSFLASGSDDGTVRFWDAATHQEFFRTQENTGVQSVALSRHGNLCAAACNDETVKVWDVTDPRVPKDPQEFPGPGTFVALSRDGRLLASGGRGRGITLRDLQTGQVRQVFQQEAEPLRAAFSPDGHWLAWVSWGGAPVRVWDMAANQEWNPLHRPAGNW